MVREIEIVPYNPAWTEQYQSEAKRITSLLGPHLIAIHHIGSTAVFKLAAKPTIDMLLVVTNHEELESHNKQMLKLDYHPMGENGIPGRRYFQKLEGGVHKYHLHAFETGNPDINRHLYFRDYLREHPDDSRAYQALKLQLAARFPFDSKSYTSGKSAFIREMDRRAIEYFASNSERNENFHE